MTYRNRPCSRWAYHPSPLQMPYLLSERRLPTFTHNLAATRVCTCLKYKTTVWPPTNECNDSHNRSLPPSETHTQPHLRSCRHTKWEVTSFGQFHITTPPLCTLDCSIPQLTPHHTYTGNPLPAKAVLVPWRTSHLFTQYTQVPDSVYVCVYSSHTLALCPYSQVVEVPLAWNDTTNVLTDASPSSVRSHLAWATGSHTQPL